MSLFTGQTAAPPANNLWGLAAARLRNKNKVYLELSPPAKFDATDLLSALNDRKTECERKQWTVKKVVLRDVFTKIAVWVEKFVEVGDVVVSFDPGYAALP